MSLLVQSEQPPVEFPSVRDVAQLVDANALIVDSSLWSPVRSFGFARNAIVLPSGDHEGEKHERVPSVKHRNSPACPFSIDNV